MASSEPSRGTGRLPRRMRPADRLRPLGRYEPWVVLGPLALVQWLAAIAFALTRPHNGWFFAQGPQTTWTWTGGWLLGSGHLSAAHTGWAWSYALMPVSWLNGADYLRGLPMIVVLQMLIFLPLGTWLVYRLGAQVAGRLVGYFAAALWALGPYLGAALSQAEYHKVFVDGFLPQLVGLTGSAALPAALLLAASGLYALRALDGGPRFDAIAAGLAAGLAAAIDPVNLLYLAAPVLALALRRRGRAWSGSPRVSCPRSSSCSSGAPAAPDGVDLGAIGSALDVHWHRLSYTFTWIREYFWSLHVFEWLVVAGVIAVARVSPVKAVFLGAWFFAFLLSRGGDPGLDIRAGTLWPALAPALPALAVLIASIPLLVPRLGPAARRRVPPPRGRARAACDSRHRAGTRRGGAARLRGGGGTGLGRARSGRAHRADLRALGPRPRPVRARRRRSRPALLAARRGTDDRALPAVPRTWPARASTAQAPRPAGSAERSSRRPIRSRRPTAPAAGAGSTGSPGRPTATPRREQEQPCSSPGPPGFESDERPGRVGWRGAGNRCTLSEAGGCRLSTRKPKDERGLEQPHRPGTGASRPGRAVPRHRLCPRSLPRGERRDRVRRVRHDQGARRDDAARRVQPFDLTERDQDRLRRRHRPLDDGHQRQQRRDGPGPDRRH